MEYTVGTLNEECNYKILLHQGLVSQKGLTLSHGSIGFS